MPDTKHESWAAGSLTDDQMSRLAELHLAAFDPKGRTVEEYIDTRLRPTWQHQEGADVATSVYHVVFDDGRLVAKAATFGRAVGTESGTMNVLALAAVAAHPDVQGRGFGREVVLAAFQRVDDGEYPVCLFQTGRARKFYERLGARVVENQFVDSTCAEAPEDDPFSDEVAMIYPGDATWPDGTIDLLGPGY